MERTAARKVSTTERSGVLGPANLERFSALWIPPADDIREVIATYWSVQWNLGETESVNQSIIDHPSITLSIERGEVTMPYVVSAVRAKAWTRTIRGNGSVFALRLRPAGLAVLTDIDPRTIGNEREVTQDAFPRTYQLLEQIAAAPEARTKAGQADALIRQCMKERPLTRQQRLANSALDLLTHQPHVRPVSEVAASLNTSHRTLQRALNATLGRGPNEIARRSRLQEVVRRLSNPDHDISVIAVDLGYTDQAHLTNEFRAATGITPGTYLASLEKEGLSENSG